MNKKAMSYAAGIACTLWAALASAETTFALGPIDPARAPNTVSVLGQSFSITTRTLCAVNGALVSSAKCGAALTDYSYVAVEANSKQPSLAEKILVLPTAYVPGASLVKVIGRVTKTRASTGLLSINALTVDQNAVLSNYSADAAVGALVEISGTQPAYGGVVLASSRVPASGPTTQIIVGTGKAALADVSTNIIVGTGKAAPVDASTNIIVGTGRAAPVEASTNIIVGTGKAAPVDASTNIIVGTGKAAPVDASTNIIVGTGKAAPVDASTNIIVGTGKAAPVEASTNIIVGTGKAAPVEASSNIIVGTGKAAPVESSTNIIVGTGRS